MGELGADVIQIEASGGDATRHVGPSRSPGMGARFMGGAEIEGLVKPADGDASP